MTDHKTRFLNLALDAQALKFGEFTLKSGRKSPYFFNAGLFNSGRLMRELAIGYVDAIEHAGLDFDLIFGPAYKGIPLATAIAVELAARGRDLPLAYNRKEAKDHGEGGTLVGAPLQGRKVLVVDDVISAGTAIRESLDIIRANGAHIAGIAIALDRQELPGGIEPDPSNTQSATQSLSAELGVRVLAIATLADLVAFTADDERFVQHADAIAAYRHRYGA